MKIDCEILGLKKYGFSTVSVTVADSLDLLGLLTCLLETPPGLAQPEVRINAVIKIMIISFFMITSLKQVKNRPGLAPGAMPFPTPRLAPVTTFDWLSLV